jgi:Zn-dependent protease with chaperone function
LDFFAQQENSRRRSRWLVLLFLVAVLLVVASYVAAAALFHALWAKYWGASPAMPVPLALGVAALVGGSILAVSARRMWQLSDGGPAVAELLGAHYVEPGRCTPTERRLLNVVEEMAIASGIAVPPVYCLEREEAINALVAGYSPNEAVIIVTRGALTRLSRDELQGVMGHEFSHILNGDMALNVRLVGLLAGLTWLADAAEAMFFDAMWEARSKPREQRGGEAFAAVWAALVAFIGFPGTLAADAVKAAVSRQRELLADSASVQFTRNPEGIAGALDSILALRAHTVLLALHREMFSHMFFAPALARWWGFPTHPPILERIRRVHPRFLRDDYRERRHGTRQEVAVIDGGGNVVKHVKSLQTAAAIVATIGNPTAAHVGEAAKLRANLPTRLSEALSRAGEAEAVLFALALEPEEEVRSKELAALEARRGAAAAALAAELYVYAGGLARSRMLALVELAVPAIKEQKQQARDAFLADLAAVVESDRRVTLREFVLATFLRQRLREGAGLPIRTRFRSLDEVASDAHIVLSVVALAAGRRAQAAFEKGAAVLRYGWTAPLGRGALTVAGVGEALERLRHLSPFAKPGLLKACFEAAGADGEFRLAEVELVRMVAATLDCPVPPLLERVSVSS